MCIEFAWKKAGIPIIRNFMHGCEGVLGGIPQQSRNRFFINYKVKSYVNGKSVPAKLISKLVLVLTENRGGQYSRCFPGQG